MMRSNTLMQRITYNPDKADEIISALTEAGSERIGGGDTGAIG